MLVVSFYWTIFQLVVQTFATYLIGNILPTPPEINKNSYKIFYTIVERASVGKKVAWKNSPSREESEAQP